MDHNRCAAVHLPGGHPMNRASALAGLLFAAIALSGCTDREDALAPRAMRAGMLPDGKTTALVVEADLPVARLIVMVDDGLGRREVELRREDEKGLLAAALDVAPGAKARVAFSAYDAEGQLTHRGGGTLLTGYELTEQQEFALVPVPGADVAEVRIGTYRLAMSQAMIVGEPGREVQVEAVLLDARGEPHPIEKGLQWVPAEGQKEIARFDFDPRDWYVNILVIPERWYVGRVKFCTFDAFFCGGVILADPNPVIQVVTGSFHSCALRKSGVVSCWGQNTVGQLGKDAAGVSRLASTTFASISGGSLHNCGVDNAGTVWCWGANQYGQLGLGSGASNTFQPNAVSLPAAASQVTAGASHSCALLVNGETWCWGANYYGQLGDGNGAPGTNAGSSSAPVKVATAPVFASLSAGFEHTCGVTPAGEAWCWGSNTDGQSGFGNATADKCALQTTYYPSTWVNCAATPRQVQTSVTFAGIGGGSYSTCAWTSGGTGYCWGSPHGTFTYPGYGNNHVPRTPTSQPSWKFLTAATEFQCGIDAADMVQCFGDTQHGQTGTGIGLPTLTVSNPTPVTVTDSWTNIDGGMQHGCGVRSNGNVVSCWGRNDEGQLGRVTPSPTSTTPVNVTASF